MANAKLVVVVVATLLILLEVSTCAVARYHHHHHGKPRHHHHHGKPRHHHHHHHHHHDKPDPCSGEDDGGSMPGTLHKHKKPRHCPLPGGSLGTPAIMTLNGFQRGEDGGGPAACDGRYHSDKSLVVALSTRWYAGGCRCHRPIRITSRQNGRTVEAIVVYECDSNAGCKDNIVDAYEAVWKALGLDNNIGEVPVTWSDA